MIRTLIFSPFIGVQVAGLLQTIWMVGIILELKRFEAVSLEGGKKWLLRGGQALLYGALSVFSVLLLEIAIFWLLGAWTFADWRFHLPSVLLTLFVSVQILIKGSFHGRTRLKAIYIGGVVLLFQIYFRWLLPSQPVMGILLEQTLPLFLGLLIFCGFLVSLKESHDVEKSAGKGEKINRNLEEGIEKFFSPKVNVIIWVLVLLQSMLTYSGYSLFSF